MTQKEISILTIRASDSPERLIAEGETYEEYKERQRVLKQKTREHLNGRLFFVSKNYKGEQHATYNKKKESKT